MLGNGRSRRYDDRNAGLASASPQPATHPSRLMDSTVRSIEGGSSPHWSEGTAIFTTSSSRPRTAGNSISLSAALVGAACCKLLGACSVIGIRLIAFVPSDRPRALRPRASPARAPGSGSPVPADRRDICLLRRAACSREGNKKPSGAAGSGGSV